MELTPVSVDEFKVKKYLPEEYTDSEGNTKKKDVLPNCRENREELIKQYQRQLDTIFDREVDFHKDYHAATQLVRFQGKRVYADGDAFFEKLEFKIRSLLADKYNELRYEPTGVVYPIVVFFESIREKIVPYERVFYFKYHGLTKIRRFKFSQQLSKLDEIERYPVLDSFGYAVTEIFLVFCYLFGEYLKFDSNRVRGFSEYADLINKTYMKVQERMVAAVEENGGSELIETFVKGLAELCLIGSEVGKINKDVDIVAFVEECYMKGCKRIVDNICEKLVDDDIEFFHVIEERLNKCKEINEKLKDEEIPLIDVSRIAVFVSNKRMETRRSLRNIIIDAYWKQDVSRLMKVVEVCRKKGMEIELDWSDVEEESYMELLLSVEIPNEDKLKNMVRYFDGINEVLNNLKVFENVSFMSLTKTSKIFTTLWVNNFKRDIPNHLVFYMDYKLKNMVKLKDRNKFEVELVKVLSIAKFVLNPLNRNEKIKFRRKYLSLYVQRMINSLFEDDFTIYTNVCDCESEIARNLDTVYSTQAISELKFSKIHKDMVHAHDIYECTKSQVRVKVIGMKRIEELGAVNEENDNEVKLEEGIVVAMKEYKKVLKRELKNRKVVVGDTKIRLELSFRHSKFELDYGGVVIKCNLYQYLILRKFNDVPDGVTIGTDEFVRWLGINKKIVERELSCLSNVKTPLLVKNENGWKVNEELDSNDEKFKKIMVIK